MIKKYKSVEEFRSNPNPNPNINTNTNTNTKQISINNCGIDGRFFTPL
jgi:hypothetical protein